MFKIEKAVAERLLEGFAKGRQLRDEMQDNEEDLTDLLKALGAAEEEEE